MKKYLFIFLFILIFIGFGISAFFISNSLFKVIKFDICENNKMIIIFEKDISENFGTYFDEKKEVITYEIQYTTFTKNIKEYRKEVEENWIELK